MVDHSQLVANNHFRFVNMSGSLGLPAEQLDWSDEAVSSNGGPVIWSLSTSKMSPATCATSLIYSPKLIGVGRGSLGTRVPTAYAQPV